MSRSLDGPAAREAIAARLHSLSPDAERRWGTMTVGQMICHLDDGFRMATGERPVKPLFTAWTRTGVKWFALWAPMPWPKGVRTLPQLDSRRDGTPPEKLAADVARLESGIETFVQAVADGRCAPHPLFGPLSQGEWLRWGWLHTDHHLRQFGN